MSKKSIPLFIAVLLIFYCQCTPVDAYSVWSCNTSEEGWGEPTTKFTTSSKAVYINIVTPSDPSDEGIPIKLDWYRPDGTREDIDRNIFTPVYRSGIYVGFYGYMAIKGKDRQLGKWRVEHWARGYSGGVLDWYLMCATSFNITDKVADPIFSPPPGKYTNPQMITLSCSTSLATIRYTTNGSEPTISSPIYSRPIDVSETTTIKAKAYKSGKTPSNTVTGTFTIYKPMPWIPFLLMDD